MLNLLNERICVILINNLHRHFCFYIKFMIWVYDNCFNNVVTSKSGGGGDNGNMAMLPWLPFHNRFVKLSYFRRSTTKMIDLKVYNTCVFVFRKKKKLWVQSHYILNNPRRWIAHGWCCLFNYVGYSHCDFNISAEWFKYF